MWVYCWTHQQFLVGTLLTSITIYIYIYNMHVYICMFVSVHVSIWVCWNLLNWIVTSLSVQIRLGWLKSCKLNALNVHMHKHGEHKPIERQLTDKQSAANARKWQSELHWVKKVGSAMLMPTMQLSLVNALNSVRVR